MHLHVGDCQLQIKGFSLIVVVVVCCLTECDIVCEVVYERVSGKLMLMVILRNNDGALETFAYIVWYFFIYLELRLDGVGEGIKIKVELKPNKISQNEESKRLIQPCARMTQRLVCF